MGDAVRWILTYRASMQRPDPEFAVEFGSLLIRSALRETILFREVTSTRELDDDLLLEELVRMFLTYVGASPTRSNAPDTGEAGVS